MAALAAVYARALGEQAPDDPSVLSTYLLRREWDYWRLLHTDAQRGTRPELLARAVGPTGVVYGQNAKFVL